MGNRNSQKIIDEFFRFPEAADQCRSDWLFYCLTPAGAEPLFTLALAIHVGSFASQFQEYEWQAMSAAVGQSRR
jgi:hypothetical protein